MNKYDYNCVIMLMSLVILTGSAANVLLVVQNASAATSSSMQPNCMGQLPCPPPGMCLGPADEPIPCPKHNTGPGGIPNTGCGSPLDMCPSPNLAAIIKNSTVSPPQHPVNVSAKGPILPDLNYLSFPRFIMNSTATGLLAGGLHAQIMNDVINAARQNQNNFTKLQAYALDNLVAKKLITPEEKLALSPIMIGGPHGSASERIAQAKQVANESQKIIEQLTKMHGSATAIALASIVHSAATNGMNATSAASTDWDWGADGFCGALGFAGGGPVGGIGGAVGCSLLAP
jgi:hypothetical protein